MIRARMLILAATAALAAGSRSLHTPSPPPRRAPIEISRAPVLEGDEAIAATVQDRIVEFVKPPREVNVVVSGGILVLRGWVVTLRAHRQLIEIGRATPGVRAIVDEVRIASTARRDLDLARDVRVALASERAVDEPKLTVRAERGTVFLDGVVGSAVAAGAAKLAAASVAGVRRIADRIIVLPAPSPSDHALARDVRFMLSRYPLGLRGLQATAHGGVVFLYGKVGSEAEKARAADLAALPGVRAVIAHAVTVDDRIRESWVLRAPRPPDDVLQDAVLVAFALEESADANLAVTVHDGVAVLSGSLPTPKEQARLVALAAAVVGVREVVDELTPLAPRRARRFDRSLEQLAVARVARSTHYPTHVRVRGRVATVAGVPRSRPAQREIEDALYDIAGIREVVLHLDAPSPPTS